MFPRPGGSTLHEQKYPTSTRSATYPLLRQRNGKVAARARDPANQRDSGEAARAGASRKNKGIELLLRRELAARPIFWKDASVPGAGDRRRAAGGRGGGPPA